MTQHAGQLVHPVGALEHTPIYVDKTARERERVYVAGIHDREMPIQITSRCQPRNPLAYIVHVVVDRGVVHHRKLLLHLRGLLLSHLDFLLSRYAAGGEQRDCANCD